MRICKFPRSLTENDYQQILSRWLEGAGTKSKSQQIIHRSQNIKKNFQYLYIRFYLYSTCLRKKDEDIKFFLLYAHKSCAYFLIFLKSLKFLKPRYFSKYKSNVLKQHWEKALGTKWFLAFPVVFFPTGTSFRFCNFVFC